ncbi:MAG: Holliday junction resolvase RecU [Bacilli bacterium]|nr:Holliday junction resolvase RecU [Bacilli bacterium]
MINYPNKKVVSSQSMTKEEKNEKTKERKILSAANRGMDFEHAVNTSNTYYDDCQRAIITKRPTPIRVVKVDYAHNARIVDAYFEKQSTTDYNGVYKGKYIDFECKETKSKTALTFNNISLHQINHLKKVLYHGGIAFFLIYFVELSEVYLLDAKYVIEAYEHKEIRKSLSLTYIKENGHLVEQGFIPRLKYLDVVDEVYFNEKENF